MKKDFLKWLLPMIVILNACSKDDVKPTPPVVSVAKGLYVLSEGGFNQNNTKLGFYSFATNTYAGDFFLQQNPTITAGLGDTGNDMVIYGGKLYIVMNVSSNVTVLNAFTGKFITTIPFKNGTSDKTPRYALGTRGKIFVTSWDNTVSVIDTTTLQITNTIAVGATPEGIATTGNYLYIANSGGINTVFDSTVSVVDLNTLSEIKKIVVGLNPQKVEVNSAGDVYVTGYGNAYPVAPAPVVPAFASVINSSTNTLKSKLGADYQFDHVRIFNDIAYFYNNYGGNTIKVYNTITNTLVRNNFISDGTTLTTSYGLNIDDANGDVYITDAKDFTSSGSVTCFNKDGVKKFSFSTTPGVSPNKVIFIR
jgi:YVTN family beta-propeller protein